MKTTKILVTEDERYTHIECPHCTHWEAHPIDEQRHHIQTFKFLAWEPDEEGINEFSLMECCVCKEHFRLEWDYKNIDKEE